MSGKSKWLIGGLAGLGLALFYAVTLFKPPAPPKPVASSFQIEDVNVINPMISRNNAPTLIVADGRIELAGEPSGKVLQEFRGMYVLPGLIDMHTHVATDNVLKLNTHYGLLHLAHGVTTVRDAGDLDGSSIPAARKIIAEGRRPFPHLISCGPFVSKGVTVWPNTIHIDRIDEAERVIDEIAAGGHGCVKAYEGLTPELIGALNAAAIERGLHVIGHVPDDLTLEQSGLPDVQHFFGVARPENLPGKSVLDRNGDWSSVDDERMQTVLDYVIENDIRNTPTITILSSFLDYADYETAAARSKRAMPSLYAEIVWNPVSGLAVYRNAPEERLRLARDALPKKLEFARRLSEAGGVLHLGTDAGQPFTAPGVSLWDEMKLFAEAGIPPEQVWAYGTNVAGDSLTTKAGRVIDGGAADFLIFRDDPTVSLEALNSLQAVVIGGQLYRKSDLDAGVQRSLDHYESWPLRPISHFAVQRTLDKATANFKN